MTITMQNESGGETSIYLFAIAICVAIFVISLVLKLVKLAIAAVIIAIVLYIAVPSFRETKVGEFIDENIESIESNTEITNAINNLKDFEIDKYIPSEITDKLKQEQSSENNN